MIGVLVFFGFDIIAVAVVLAIIAYRIFRYSGLFGYRASDVAKWPIMQPSKPRPPVEPAPPLPWPPRSVEPSAATKAAIAAEAARTAYDAQTRALNATLARLKEWRND